jgi:hypothetical protein
LQVTTQVPVAGQLHGPSSAVAPQAVLLVEPLEELELLDGACVLDPELEELPALSKTHLPAVH